MWSMRGFIRSGVVVILAVCCARAAIGAAPKPAGPAAGQGLEEAAFDEAIFSPDGKFVVTAARGETVNAHKGALPVAVWDSQTGQLVRTLGDGKEAIEAVAFSHDGNQIAAGGSKGVVHVWETQTGKAVREWEAGAPVDFVQFSFADKRLLTHARDGEKRAKVWDLTTGKLLLSLGDQMTEGTSFDRANEHVLTWGKKEVTIWNADSGAAETHLTLDGETEFRSAEFSPDGTHVATGCNDDKVRMWDVASGMMLKAIWDGGSHMNQGHFSQDGSQLLVYGGGSAMVNTRLDGGMGQGRFNLPSSAIVLQAAFSPDMTRIVLVRNAQRSDEAISKSAPAVTGHTIFMWDTRRARWIEGYHTDNALKGTPLAVFSPDGKRLLAHLDKTMMLDPAMGETIPWKAP